MESEKRDGVRIARRRCPRSLTGTGERARWSARFLQEVKVSAKPRLILPARWSDMALVAVSDVAWGYCAVLLRG